MTEHGNRLEYSESNTFKYIQGYSKIVWKNINP